MAANFLLVFEAGLHCMQAHRMLLDCIGMMQHEHFILPALHG